MEQNNNLNLDDEEWIILNEIITSPFYTGNFNGSDELEPIQITEFLLNSPNNKTIVDNETINQVISLTNDEKQSLPNIKSDEKQKLEEIISEPYQSLILTPEFLISLDVFTKNMNWLSKEVAFKCIQSSQTTTNNIKSISQIIKNQCRAIASITSSNSFYSNYDLQI